MVTKKEVREVEKEEEKVLKFLTRSFHELKKLLKQIKLAEVIKEKGDKKNLEKSLKKILRKLRSSIFGSEERIERKLAREENKMDVKVEHLIEELILVMDEQVKSGQLDSVELTKSSINKIKKILNELKPFSAELKKFCSRGGEIETELKKTKDIKKAHEEIQKAAQDILASEVLINDLHNITENVKTELNKMNNLRAYIEKYSSLFKIKINSEKDLDNLFCRVAYTFGIENDVKIYIVGGYVRDKITGFESKDLDCNVSKDNDRFAKLFCQIVEELFGFKFSTNQQSSTGNWKISCVDIKSEGYDVNRYKGDIKLALSTPDFTMNGLAIDITPKISQNEFIKYSQSLIYENKLSSKNYKFLIYPDELFLKDAENKIFRIPDSTKRGKDPKLGPRLLKFYERFFSDFEAKGFTIDKSTFNFLIINSGYLKIAKSGYLFKLQAKKEFKKIRSKPYFVKILTALEQFRKEENNRTHQEFIIFSKDVLQEFDEKKCNKIYDFSFFPIREAIEEFIFSKDQNKSYKNFLKLLKKKSIDVVYFGEKEVVRLWDNKQNDPSLSYINMVSRDYGQSLGFVIKTLKGTSKWLKNFNGDEDLRIYNCFKSTQDEGNIINSLIEEFNLENIKFLKVQGISNEYIRTDIRIGALLADLRFNVNPNIIGDERGDIPESINKVFRKMSKSSTFTKQNQFFISVLLNIKEILLVLRFFLDSEKHMIINSVKIKNMIKYMSKKNMLFIGEDELINILFDQALNIIKSCSSLKGTKFFNPKFNVNIQEIEVVVQKLRTIISDKEKINFYSKPLIQNSRKLMTIGFKGPKIRLAKSKQIEAQIEGKIKTQEDAEHFLKELVAA